MSQLVVCAPASAYEDQATLGVGLGYAYAAMRGEPHHGAAVALEASVGLGPSWSVRGSLGYSLHPAQHSLSRLTAAAELLYLVDVLELVPYFGLGADALGSWAERRDGWHSDVGVHPVLGADWLLSRDLLIGLVVRPVFVLSDWKNDPFYLSVMVTGSLALEL